MSATGAGSELTVPPQYRIRLAHDLPDRVMLILMHDRVEIDCRIQWRLNERFGARFTSPSRPFERCPPTV